MATLPTGGHEIASMLGKVAGRGREENLQVEVQV